MSIDHKQVEDGVCVLTSRRKQVEGLFEGGAPPLAPVIFPQGLDATSGVNPAGGVLWPPAGGA